MADPLSEKTLHLRAILRGMKSALVCFSAGVDSTLLLKLAAEELGEGAVEIPERLACLAGREKVAVPMGTKVEEFLGWLRGSRADQEIP